MDRFLSTVADDAAAVEPLLLLVLAFLFAVDCGGCGLPVVGCLSPCEKRHFSAHVQRPERKNEQILLPENNGDIWDGFGLFLMKRIVQTVTVSRSNIEWVTHVIPRVFFRKVCATN